MLKDELWYLCSKSLRHSLLPVFVPDEIFQLCDLGMVIISLLFTLRRLILTYSIDEAQQNNHYME